MRHYRFIQFLLGFAMCGSATAGVIGQWNGSAVDLNGIPTSWNNASFYSDIKGLATGAGYTVRADTDASAANLAGCDTFVVGGASRSAAADEVSALTAWVTGGGLLLMLTDRDDNAAPLNALLAAMGSGVSYGGGTMDQNFYMGSGVFAASSPYSVSGSWFSGTPGRVVAGGTTLTFGGAGWTASQQSAAEAYIHYQKLGLGYVFVLGDRLDNNYFAFDAGTPRANFFLNLGNYAYAQDLTGSPDPPTGGGDVPEPSTLLLAGAGVAALVWRGRAARRG